MTENEARALLEKWAEDQGVSLLGDEHSSYDELSPGVVEDLVERLVAGATTRCDITQHLTSQLHRQRGDNTKLARDVLRLPRDSQDRLFRVLRDMEMEVASERSKRRRYGLP